MVRRVPACHKKTTYLTCSNLVWKIDNEIVIKERQNSKKVKKSVIIARIDSLILFFDLFWSMNLVKIAFTKEKDGQLTIFLMILVK